MRPSVDFIRYMSSPYSNGLFFVGGRSVAPNGSEIYVFGKGSTKKKALNRLFGEAAERASVLASKNNSVWRAEDIITNEVHLVIPAVAFGAGWRPNSHGCAAHNLCDTARYLAALELFERSAVERWWAGQSKPRRILLCGSQGAWLSERIGVLREHAPLPRRTELFQLGLSSGVFVIAALSFGLEGERMAIAFAADSNWPQAALRAVHELLSVELETADLLLAETEGAEIGDGSNRALVRDREIVLQKRYELELAQCDQIDLSQIKTLWPNSLNALAHIAAQTGEPLLFIDMTLESIGVPVSRAIFKAHPHLPFQYPTSEILPL